ncbi:MSC_0621 family F1-like ATPase epsilon subunit [Mycoplasma buteonis]|uniref:MSC_0621 family F1-like ATPase epsilon subunit n=1 Tax=Mycoplasma buteonis TaxID=171280 RepID=UPI00056C3A77|nr:hypothetical protein [Mycoplasma buteonis]
MTKIKFTSHNLEVTRMQIEKLEINTDFSDRWVTFKKNSVASYKQVFLKLILTNKKTIYLILDNTFLTYVDEVISVRYNGELVQYVQNTKQKEKLEIINQKLKKLKQEIKLHQAYYDLNINNLDLVEMQKLKHKLFVYEAISSFSLERLLDEKN